MEPVTMRAILVGTTEVRSEFWDVIRNTEMLVREAVYPDAYNKDAELLAEAAGRVCYDSFHLPNEKTRTNTGYLANIKKQMHYSVLEHANYTFYLEGVSRATLTELTRHRHLSFSVRSQRYCDESESDYVVPPALLRHQSNPRVIEAIVQGAWLHRQARRVYGEVQKALEDAGESRKTANDAARYFLPEGTVTKLFLTGNGRTWLELLTKRDSPAAAEEIRVLATKVRQALWEHSKHIFSPAPEEDA